MYYTPIVFKSAAEFWLDGTGRHINDQYSLEKRKLFALPAEWDSKISSVAATELIAEYNLPAPLNIMIPSKNEYHNTQYNSCFVRPAHLPAGSFIKLDSTTLMATPELCFLMAARELPLHLLVKLGNNLCAAYVIDKNAATGQRFREPICSIKSLKAYLDRCTGITGIKKARQALKFISENAYSPMENFLAVMNNLPIRFGGYMLSLVLLNYRIILPKDAAKMFGFDSCVVDLKWDNHNLAVEYDSNLTHLDINQHIKDKRKIDALEMAGYKVISLTADHVKSLIELDESFNAIRKALGLRSHRKELEEAYAIRYQVRKDLLTTGPTGF